MVVCLSRLVLLILCMGAQDSGIKSLRFTGNKGFPDSRLRDAIRTRPSDLYTDSLAARDSADLVRFYRNQGYPWIKVSPDYHEKKRRLTYTVEQGSRLKVAGIELLGVPAEDETPLVNNLPLKKKKPLTLLGMQETERLAKRYFQNRGYPYAVVKLDTVKAPGYDSTNIKITLSVAPGQKAWIKYITFQGYPAKPAKNWINVDFLHRTARLKQGSLFSIGQIDRASSQLYSTGLFTYIDMSTLKVAPDTPDSLEVLFELTPAKQRVVLLGGGLQTDQGKLAPDRLLVTAGWEHLNFFHRGIGFASEISFTPHIKGEYYDLDFELRNRYPNLPWGLALTLSPFIQNNYRKDSLGTNIFTYVLGGDAGLGKTFSDVLRLGISMQAKQVWIRPTSYQSSVEGATNFLRISATYESRNDFFNPKAGVFVSPYADWAGKPFGGDNDFIRLHAEIRNYLEMPFESVLAWRIKGGLIIPHSGETYEDIPYTEKFVLGGSGTVRGIPDRGLGPDSVFYRYKEFSRDVGDTTVPDSVPLYHHYGTMVLMQNFEIRTPFLIQDLVGFVVFLDAGMCSRDPDTRPVPARDWDWSPGIGVRVNTPLGPIRLDYSKNILTPYRFTRDPYDNSIDIGRIEIGFLQAF